MFRTIKYRLEQIKISRNIKTSLMSIGFIFGVVIFNEYTRKVKWNKFEKEMKGK